MELVIVQKFILHKEDTTFSTLPLVVGNDPL